MGENGISYTLGEDGLYYPDLYLPEETEYPIGKYGMLRKTYLKEHRKGLYLELVLAGKLNEHLHQVDEECNQMMDRLVEQMKEKQGVTEKLKMQDQMAWVGAMNSIRNRAEEIVLAELIYEEDEVCESLKNFGTAILSQQSITHLLAKNIKSCWS